MSFPFKNIKRLLELTGSLQFSSFEGPKIPGSLKNHAGSLWITYGSLKDHCWITRKKQTFWYRKGVAKGRGGPLFSRMGKGGGGPRGGDVGRGGRGGAPPPRRTWWCTTTSDVVVQIQQ